MALGANTTCLNCSEPVDAHKHKSKHTWLETNSKTHHHGKSHTHVRHIHTHTLVLSCDWSTPTSAVCLIGRYFTIGGGALRVYISQDETSEIDVDLTDIHLKVDCSLEEVQEKEEKVEEGAGRRRSRMRKKRRGSNSRKRKRKKQEGEEEEE